jgi:hypothetical protein
MRFKHLLVAICAGAFLATLGCGSGLPPSGDLPSAAGRPGRVDLDRVLKILSETLDQMDLKAIGKASDKELEAMAAQKPDDKGKELAAKPMDKEKEQAFLKAFAENLNNARLIDDPIGVTMIGTGAIQGFVDKNRDGVKEGSGEKELFKVQLDPERKRIIASDASNQHHRDHHYGFSPGGFFMGYLLATMLSRQRASGFDASKLGQTKMSPEGYYKTSSRGPAAPSAAAPASKPGATTAGPPGSTPTATTGKASTPAPVRGQGGSRGFSVGK